MDMGPVSNRLMPLHTVEVFSGYSEITQIDAQQDVIILLTIFEGYLTQSNRS